nr:FAD-binding protein [Clostridia bacterium]
MNLHNTQTEYDVLVVGAGVAGLNCALHLPASFRVLVISKGGLRESDSFLAQGGICVLRGHGDFDGYFEA